MSLYGVYNATEHVQNMSRVYLGEPDLVCLSNGSGNDTSCSIPSGLGISLSTPILMMTIGVVGNVLALLVLYSSRREAQARRTVFFVMLAGLAWTDLVGQLSVSPIAIVTYANNLQWVGGTPLCRYHGFMMVSFGLVIPLVVSCMSCERFIAIRFSYFYARHITRRKAQLTFLACWTVTALFTALPFVGFGSYERQYPGSWCFLNFHRERVLDVVYAAMFAFLNVIAISVMIVCNVVVAVTLLRMRRSKHLNSSASLDRKLSVSGVVGSSTTPGTVIRGKRHSDMEAQMVWFLCLITVAFTICWLPLNIHILLTQLTGNSNQALDLIVIRMASCNQILDPWLYVIFRKNSLLRIMRRIKSCFGKKKEPPRNGTFRGPSVRYVMGNRSFTIEATTVGKTVMPTKRGNQCPLYTFRDNCCHESSQYSPTSLESMSRLLCISSNYDDHSHRRRSDQKPLIDLRLGHSPTDHRKFQTHSDGQYKLFFEKDTEFMSNTFNASEKCVSLPLIDKVKDRTLWNRRLVNDTSDAKDIFSHIYDSVGSTHYITDNCKPSIKPGTPTNELSEMSDSDTKYHEPQRQPPKSLKITDSNYLFISPPPSTPSSTLTKTPTMYTVQNLTPLGRPRLVLLQNGNLPDIGEAASDGHVGRSQPHHQYGLYSKSHSENTFPQPWCSFPGRKSLSIEMPVRQAVSQSKSSDLSQTFSDRTSPTFLFKGSSVDCFLHSIGRDFTQKEVTLNFTADGRLKNGFCGKSGIRVHRDDIQSTVKDFLTSKAQKNVSTSRKLDTMPLQRTDGTHICHTGDTDLSQFNGQKHSVTCDEQLRS